ncbi:hypothetical protein C4564_03260 [Candidatus Microgenomates bacterium]|nr:MAG: hypothetical protein C4564_03260 [Candidatus Microgenomates bacterium]
MDIGGMYALARDEVRSMLAGLLPNVEFADDRFTVTTKDGEDEIKARVLFSVEVRFVHNQIEYRCLVRLDYNYRAHAYQPTTRIILGGPDMWVRIEKINPNRDLDSRVYETIEYGTRLF